MNPFQAIGRCSRPVLKAARRLLARLPASREGAIAAVTSPWDYRAMPLHDRPSGYFSARNEGKTKNTTATPSTILP
jgi:hypothetical protein